MMEKEFLTEHEARVVVGGFIAQEYNEWDLLELIEAVAFNTMDEWREERVEDEWWQEHVW